MSTPYYSENTGRSYPFLRDEEIVSNASVVDFGCTVGLDSGFVEGTHTVWLAEVSRDVGEQSVTFKYRSDAPQLAGYELRFTFLLADGKFITQFSDAQIYDDVDSDPEACQENDRWYGFMVCGELDELYAALASPVTGTAEVEPAVIESLVQSYVRSINLANQDRTRAARPSGCQDYEWPFDIGDIFVHSRCLDGDVVLIPGFNCSIRRVEPNGFVIDAEVGAGEGEPHEEISLFDGEAPPDGSTLYTGGPECSELIRTINGISARNFLIEAGRGATLDIAPANDEIVIDVNMSQLAICDFEDVDESDCGPPDCELEL